MTEVGDKVYFTDEQRKVLGDLAETARAFLYKNPTRAEFDTFQTNFLAIQPSFYPIAENPSLTGNFSQDTILTQYQDAQRRLYTQAI